MDSSSFFSFSSHYHSTSILPYPHPFAFPSQPITPVPIDFMTDPPIPIPVQNPSAEINAAATRIQAAYRSHLTRTLLRRIAAVDAEAARYEATIRTQETVDAVRRDERERLRVSEGLMELILRLDSVPGFYPAVREVRRGVSRRIVVLQEILDAVAGESIVGLEEFPATWEDVVFGIPVAVGCACGRHLGGTEPVICEQDLNSSGVFQWQPDDAFGLNFPY